jgi:hypothetical protein
VSSAARRPPSSCVRAGTAPSSTTGRTSRSPRPPQNLIVSPPEDLVALIRQCDGFGRATRLACYGWLGKVLAVLTDGQFEQYGCESLAEGPARRACLRSAGEIDEPLVTFS